MAPQAKQLSLEQRIMNIERLLKWLGGFSGISLVVLLAFAYYLGGISTKVSNSEETLKTLSESVSGKEGLLVRASLIESQLNSLNTRLASMDTKLDAIKIQTLREHNTVIIRTSTTQRPKPKAP